MVTKGASNGIPSLHARKRRNMVREMSDQLLDTVNKPVDDEESDKSDDVTDDEIEHVQAEQFVPTPRTTPLVNNFMTAETSTPIAVLENNDVGHTNSSHVDDDEDIEDKPKDYRYVKLLVQNFTTRWR